MPEPVEFSRLTAGFRPAQNSWWKWSHSVPLLKKTKESCYRWYRRVINTAVKMDVSRAGNGNKRESSGEGRARQRRTATAAAVQFSMRRIPSTFDPASTPPGGR